MIIDGRLVRGDVPDIGVFKCVITKEEFLECYNAWVRENNNADSH